MPFEEGSVVYLGGIPLATTYVSPTQLSAVVPASSVLSVGTFNVTVIGTNGTSNSVPFEVTFPTPVILGISPVSVPAGSPDTQITLTGYNFSAGSIVLINGDPISPLTATPTEIQCIVPASYLVSPGTLSIAVQELSATSDAFPFVVGPQTTVVVSEDGGFSPGQEYSFPVPADNPYLELDLVGGGGAGAVAHGVAASLLSLSVGQLIGAGGGGASGQSLSTTSPIELEPGSNVFVTIGNGGNSAAKGGDSKITYTPVGGSPVTITASGGSAGGNSNGTTLGKGGPGGDNGSVVTPVGYSSAHTGGGGGGASIGNISLSISSAGTVNLGTGDGGQGGSGTPPGGSGDDGGDSNVTVQVTIIPNTVGLVSAVGGAGGNGGGIGSVLGGEGGGTASPLGLSITIIGINIGLGGTSTIAGGGGGGASLVSSGGDGGRYSVVSGILTLQEATAGKNGSGGGGGINLLLLSGQSGMTTTYTPGGAGYASLRFLPPP
jgi:hypothetical protein